MLLRPSPFPEEIDRGYLGRVMRFNGITTESEAINLIARWSGNAGKSRYEVTNLELLSKVADIELGNGRLRPRIRSVVDEKGGRMAVLLLVHILVP